MEGKTDAGAFVSPRFDDSDGSWITTENGHKVHISEEGVPDKGNPHVLSKMTGGTSKAKKSGGSKSAPKTKVKMGSKKEAKEMIDMAQETFYDRRRTVRDKQRALESQIEDWMDEEDKSTRRVGGSLVQRRIELRAAVEKKYASQIKKAQDDIDEAQKIADRYEEKYNDIVEQAISQFGNS